MTVTLKVQEEELPGLLAYARQHQLEVLENGAEEDQDFEVPEWHKAEVLKTLAETNEEDYIPMEEAFKSWDEALQRAKAEMR